MRIAPVAILAPVLLLAAGFFHGPTQLSIWAVALAIDYLEVLFARTRGWRISPEHFVERFGLIIIIALGESIVAIGVGAAGDPLDAGEITAALLGVTVAACLWWSYFDWVIFVGQALLEDVTGAERAGFARDVYPYLHMPMVTGIVLFAFGLATTLAGDGDRLALVPAVGLCGDVALYLLAHVVVRLRMRGGLRRGRPIAAALLLGLIPVATAVPAVVALGLVTATCVCLIAYEALRHRASRTWIRSRRGDFTLEEVRRIAENDRLRRPPGSNGSIKAGGEAPSTDPAWPDARADEAPMTHRLLDVPRWR